MDEFLLADSAELERGTDVGGYAIESRLGSGGMGVVYAAKHPLIGKRAAVKVLRPELSTDVRAVERFVTEARAVNQIGHPNIVDIFAFGALPDGRHYYVMDLLVGESLRARLQRTGAVHISEAAVAIDEIASALIAAHAVGIVHRDLKPDNVFMMSVLGRWPEVKLLDWGLAKLLSPTSKFRTVTGALLGTPMYMSPEQARAADTVDARTDIYSLGVIAYELLTGITPFRRSTSMETLLAHAEEAVPPLTEFAPATPEELAQLIEAMLAKERDQRPTLAAVRTVLRRLKGSKIPTMTAAGIAMEPPPLEPGFPRPETDELHTLDDTDSRERPPPRSAGVGFEQATAPVTVEEAPPPSFMPAGPPAGAAEPIVSPRTTLAGTGSTPPPLNDKPVHSGLPLRVRIATPVAVAERRVAQQIYTATPNPTPPTTVPAHTPPPHDDRPKQVSAPAPMSAASSNSGPIPMPTPPSGTSMYADPHPVSQADQDHSAPDRSRWLLVALVVVAILGGFAAATAFLL